MRLWCELIDPAPFALGPSLLFLLMVVVGGSGTLLGPFVGAAVAVLLPEWLRFAQGYYLMFYAALVIVLMMLLPERSRRSLATTDRAGRTASIRGARRRYRRSREGGRAMTATVLEVRDLTKSFGGIPRSTGCRSTCARARSSA